MSLTVGTRHLRYISTLFQHPLNRDAKPREMMGRAAALVVKATKDSRCLTGAQTTTNPLDCPFTTINLCTSNSEVPTVDDIFVI